MASMSPPVRKAFLAVHVIASVGWIGAVVAFLVLALAGARSPDLSAASAFGVAVATTGWWAVVPFCLAALLTGVVQSLGTPWGLVRHYWLTIKLLLTLAATLALLIHMQPTTWLGDAAMARAATLATLVALQQQLAVDAGAALVVLVLATLLSIYKPPGLTPLGWRWRDAKLPL
jgi:hypothetical protein